MNILKERLATEYIFYRYPNIYFIVLLPLLPSLMILLLKSNLYEITDGIYGTVVLISKSIVLDFFFYYKLIISIVTSFFVVYRWSLIKKDGSYGFWITQGLGREKLIGYVVFSYAILVASSEITGILILVSYFRLQFTFLQIIGIIIGIILNNFLFSLVAIIIADLVIKPEIAGMIFVTISVINITLNTNQSSVFYRFFRLENNFDSEVYFVTLALEFIIVLVLGGVLVYLQRLKDITL